MNSAPFNAAALNAPAEQATVVFLPSGSTGFTFTVNERVSSFLSGDTGFSLDTSGDLAKVSNLGQAPTGFSLTPMAPPPGSLRIIGAAGTGFSMDVDGTMSVFTGVPLGLASAGFSMEASGDLTKYAIIPPGEIATHMDAAGTLSLLSLLAGDTGMDVELAGDLIAEVYLGEQSVGFGFEASGNLDAIRFVFLPDGATGWSIEADGQPTLTANFSGDTGFDMDVIGAIGRSANLQGNTTTAWDLMGVISSNTTIADRPENTMVRPRSDRDMVSQ